MAAAETPHLDARELWVIPAASAKWNRVARSVLLLIFCLNSKQV